MYPGDVERVARGASCGRRGGRGRWGDGTDGADVFVVLAPQSPTTADELLEHCRARCLDYAVHRTVVFTDALPRSTVGKLLRHELANSNSAERHVIPFVDWLAGQTRRRDAIGDLAARHAS